jgi:hypothetical protein
MLFVSVRSEGADIWNYHSKQHLVTLKPQFPALGTKTGALVDALAAIIIC